ncbi:MAG: thiamine phosphate synthase [Phycisphaerales bacterium]|nr:thiamine phosphate synthase [Phycisphaerales bacterium]
MTAHARILDANANRAREALRVLEDIARFALDDAGLSGELKELRHELQAVIESLPIDRGVLLASRATESDVGTSIHTAAEYRRDGLASVAGAAAGRVTEAFRCIAEFAKVLGAPDSAARVEQARYRAYSIEQRLLLAIGGARRQWRLCVLITESLCKAMPWDRVAEAALAGGADCLQLREKSLDGGELLRRARRLRAITRAAGASLIINDRPDIAMLSGADGVHVGQSDLSIRDVRALAGFTLRVGISTSGLDEARRAAADGADYCGVGPMFPTTTKDKPRLAGPAYLRDYLADPVSARVPHLAIGGVTPANAGELAVLGCRGLAVSSAVCGSADPRSACRELLELLTPVAGGAAARAGGAGPS